MPTATPTSRPIRVATLNTWSLPGPLAKHPRDRMRAIVALLPDLDLDVIAFQEVWTRASRDALIAGAKGSGLPYIWHNPRLTGGSGLLVATRLPLRKVHFETFVARGYPERLRHLDFYAGKGFARIELETPDGPVVLVDTHLHANYSRNEANADDDQHDDEYLGVRAAQFIQLAAGLSEVRDPLIVLGDFNLLEDEDAYPMLLGLSGLRDLAAELDHRQFTSLGRNPYHHPEHHDERIDYVFCRDGTRLGLRPVSIERSFDEILDFDGVVGACSDHAGLVAELQLDPEPAGGTKDALRAQAFEIGAGLLEAGRNISRRRRQSQRSSAAGALAAGLASLAGAQAAGRSRRHFLRGGLGFSGALSFAFLAEQLSLSLWMNRSELAAYDVAERQLTRLRSRG